MYDEFLVLFIYVDLRLQLLEPDRHPYLYPSLYAILMILPQSSAFITLRNRLNSVSNVLLVPALRTSSNR